MSKIRATACVLLTVSAMGAKAGTIIDFVALTEGTLGESIWSELKINNANFTLTITGQKTGFDPAYAYLDYTHAGLGVCGEANNQANIGKIVGVTSSANQCAPSSDDNVTGGGGSGAENADETLTFKFDHDVVIEKIWVNNTHDADGNILNPETLLIMGNSTVGPGNGYATGSKYNEDGTAPVTGAKEGNYLGSYSVAANTAFTIAYGGTNPEQFYVSGMEVRVVPIPGALVLFGSGLLGLAGIARRSNHA